MTPVLALFWMTRGDDNWAAPSLKRNKKREMGGARAFFLGAVAFSNFNRYIARK